jgi:hypothetical protein
MVKIAVLIFGAEIETVSRPAPFVWGLLLAFNKAEVVTVDFGIIALST